MLGFNKSINKTLLDVKDLCNQIKEVRTIKNTINKMYQFLRNKIRINMHKNWERKSIRIRSCRKRNCTHRD